MAFLMPPTPVLSATNSRTISHQLPYYQPPTPVLSATAFPYYQPPEYH